jgi:hypothetical protein
MLDEIFEGILEGITLGEPSKRAGNIIRILFGLMGTFLGFAGMVHVMGYDASLHFRLAGAVLFFFLACLCCFNIMFLRRWKWPGLMFALSFVGLFVVRILFGT